MCQMTCKGQEARRVGVDLEGFFLQGLYCHIMFVYEEINEEGFFC